MIVWCMWFVVVERWLKSHKCDIGQLDRFGSRSSAGNDAPSYTRLKLEGGLEGGECFSGYRVKYAKRLFSCPTSLGQIGLSLAKAQMSQGVCE